MRNSRVKNEQPNGLIHLELCTCNVLGLGQKHFRDNMLESLWLRLTKNSSSRPTTPRQKTLKD